VGIIPDPGHRFCREALEETVLVTQKILVQVSVICNTVQLLTSIQEISSVGRRLPFCAFNGGNDVFVDIGDKSWGVRACQGFFQGIDASKTLHVGDQFLSAGSNDFKARLACTTAWIANPTETVQLLEEIKELDGLVDRKNR
jgi:IMP and pyridine-specific 5'-nucleotidase